MRKYNHECVLFKQKFKIPLRNIESVMPFGFSDDLFISEFKRLYQYLWNDICSRYQEYKRMDDGLVKKGFPKRYFFPKPNDFLFQLLQPNINRERKRQTSSGAVDSKLRDELKVQLLDNCNEKIAKRRQKIRQNLLYVQQATPEYTNYYIQTYFDGKRHNPKDVDSRYAVLKEASLYRCPATIQFLHKVNASERNFPLRYFAFSTLQKFGIKEVRLRKNRKGKKRVGDMLQPAKITTPDELLTYIYTSQLEKMKTYDLFLSHSSLDSSTLLELKAILNSSNINVYIDWVNDKEALKRTLTSASTAKVIIERLNVSKSMMYIHTISSLNSKWTPWELGYFHALKNKICVYIPEKIDEIPPYLEIYPIAVLEENSFKIIDGEEECKIEDWIKL